MKRFMIWILLLMLLTPAMAFPESINDSKPFRIGMLPSLSLQKLFERFKPLQVYLEENLHRKVILVTAPNFAEYVRRAGHYDYDLYFAAPHIAALVEQEFDYRRVCLLSRGLSGYLVARSNSKFKRVEDLKGQVVSSPQRLALITMMGEDLLSSHNLKPGVDVTIEYTSTHNNAILSLLADKSEGAIVSAPIFDILKRTLHNKLTILDKTKTASHLMFMANPKLPNKLYVHLRQLMLAFRDDGPGKEFFQRSPYGNPAPIRDQDMRAMQPYVQRLRSRLGLPSSRRPGEQAKY